MKDAPEQTVHAASAADATDFAQAAAPARQPAFKSRRWLLRLGVLLLFICAGALLLFFSLPALLIAPAETQPADAILHFAIDHRTDADAYVAQLYQQGYARKIVCFSSPISWEVYPADYGRQHLIELGVPAADVTAFHLSLTECRAQVMPEVLAFVKQQGWRSVLLVVEPTGSRGMQSTSSYHFGKAQIAAYVTYSPRDYAEITAQWWRTHWKTQNIVSEALGVFLDAFYAQCR